MVRNNNVDSHNVGALTFEDLQGGDSKRVWYGDVEFFFKAPYIKQTETGCE